MLLCYLMEGNFRINLLFPGHKYDILFTDENLILVFFLQQIFIFSTKTTSYSSQASRLIYSHKAISIMEREDEEEEEEAYHYHVIKSIEIQIRLFFPC